MAGPEVFVQVPASGRALVAITARIAPGAANEEGFASFFTSLGTGNVSGSDTRCISFQTDSANSAGPVTLSGTFLVTGLSAGLHGFGMVYKTSASSTNFTNRTILVVPLE